MLPLLCFRLNVSLKGFTLRKKNAVGASGGDREVFASLGTEHGAGAVGLRRAAAGPGFCASPSPPAPQHFTQAQLTKLKHHGLAWRAPAPESAFVPGKWHRPAPRFDQTQESPDAGGPWARSAAATPAGPRIPPQPWEAKQGTESHHLPPSRAKSLQLPALPPLQPPEAGCFASLGQKGAGASWLERAQSRAPLEGPYLPRSGAAGRGEGRQRGCWAPQTQPGCSFDIPCNFPPAHMICSNLSNSSLLPPSSRRRQAQEMALPLSSQFL